MDIENEAEKKGVKLNKESFSIVFFMVGCLVIGATVGMLFPQSNPVPLATLTDSGQSTGSEIPICEPQGQLQGQELSQQELVTKVKNFVENSDTIYFEKNSLKDNGFSISIESVEEFSDYFYFISFEVLKDDKTQGSSGVYASRDGIEIIFGEVKELGEPIAYVAPPAPEMSKTERPNVKMFVMTYCPFGQQAETGLKPAIELLGEKIDFEPHFVVYSNYASGYPDYCIDEENKYCSMHGTKELNEGVRQLCIWKYNKELFWDYVSRVNDNCQMNEIETCWKEQAEAVGIDTDRIQQCFESEALELLAAEKELNEQYSVRGSPMVLINEETFTGQRSPEAYKEGICGAFIEEPGECEQELSSTSGSSTGQC